MENHVCQYNLRSTGNIEKALHGWTSEGGWRTLAHEAI